MGSKRKKPDPLAGRTPEKQLLRGVRRYVESLGGSIMVIGGIEIQTWPEDLALNFRIAVRCTGRSPKINQATSRTS